MRKQTNKQLNDVYTVYVYLCVWNGPEGVMGQRKLCEVRESTYWYGLKTVMGQNWGGKT